MDEDNFCDCNELQIVRDVSNPRDSVDVVGEGEIKVTTSIVDGKKVFTVKRVVYAPPAIAVTANPVREVGTSNNFTWNGNISAGTEAIIRREATPSGPDLSGSFAISVSARTSAVRAFSQVSHLEVEDAIHTIVQKNLGIQFFNKVYQGFSYKDGVTSGQELLEADILAMTGTIADNIKSVYNGAHTYNVPVSAVLQYVYWVYEVGTTGINQVTLSGLPFPITFLAGSHAITNQNNGAISTNFVVVRSSNKFGTGPLSLVMA